MGLTKLNKPGLFYKEKDEPRHQNDLENLSKVGRKYTVSEECQSCGICERVCPVKNIKMENKKPVFGDNCQQCMACIQWCPKRAIDYNGKAKERKRYHHPKIKVHDLF